MYTGGQGGRPLVSRHELFERCRNILEENGIDSAGFDTLCIFQDVFGERNPVIVTDRSKEVPSGVEAEITEIVRRRSEKYPLQYLLGEWEFYDYSFKVGEGVLIPRPDTETLVEHTLAICRETGMKSLKIADLCSGSGCIAITLKKEIPESEVYAIEISDEAIGYLKQNAELNHADIHIIQGDALDKELQRSLGSFDMIVSNPPYLTGEEMRELQKEVAFEPQLALYGGDDGLDFYRKLTSLWKESLSPDGCLLYEFGMGQHEAVRRILERNNFTDISLEKDGGGIIRTISGKKTV
jgi:protein-(glutamine-N5) methyltransferase, release factor-specific